MICIKNGNFNNILKQKISSLAIMIYKSIKIRINRYIKYIIYLKNLLLIFYHIK